MIRIGESEMTAGGMSAAEMPAPAAARERERRHEDGTGKRRRDGSTPNVAGHGLISLRFLWSRRERFRFKWTARASVAALHSARTHLRCCTANQDAASPRRRGHPLATKAGYKLAHGVMEEGHGPTEARP
jgi:hypothetical protein